MTSLSANEHGWRQGHCREDVVDAVVMRLPQATGIALYLLAVVAPISALVLTGHGGDWVPALLPRWRHLVLLGNSVLLAGVVAIGAVCLGTLVASVTWEWRRPPYLQLRWLVLAFAAIPAYIHALSWSTALGALGSVLEGVGLQGGPYVGGWFGSWWVQVMTYLPLAVGLALVGLESVDQHLVDAARMERPAVPVLARVVLPLAWPLLVATAGLIFVLGITDYSVPLLFQKNVYALEIYAEYSAGAGPLTTLAVSLPLVLVTVAVLFATQGGLRQLALRPRLAGGSNSVQFEWPGWFRVLQLVACGFTLLNITLPLVVLGTQVGDVPALLLGLNTASDELVTSLAAALAVALGVVVLGLAPAIAALGRSRLATWWWFLVLAPLAVPAPLIGIGLAVLWNRPFPVDAYGTGLMLVLASLARFLPVATLIIAGRLRRVDSGLLEAARVFQAGRAHGAWRVGLPLVLPGLLAAGCVAFALALGELGATIIVAPPGRATLAIRIYNLLHYGATELVAGLCLFLVLLTLAAAAMALVALRGGFGWTGGAAQRSGSSWRERGKTT